MDAEFILTLASQSWLKWFRCSHCCRDYTISKDGCCTECDEPLMLVRCRPIKCDFFSVNPGNLNFLIPWQSGSSSYYYTQWNQLVVPMKEVLNS